MLDIERILQEKGISRSKLAELMGTNRSYVTNVLAKNNPTVETLNRIADAIDVDVVDLFRRKNENRTPFYTKDENGHDVVIGYLNFLI